MAELDLTTETEQALASFKTARAAEPYDPQKHGDETRRKIAIWLLWILAGVLLAGFATFSISLIVTKCDKDCAERTADILMKLMGLVFAPVVALVGSAMGFYFGAHPKNDPSPSPAPLPPPAKDSQ